MTSQAQGEIVSIHICVGHREPMAFADSTLSISRFGLEGDGHATSDPGRSGRQVLLMDRETLDRLGLAPGDIRENITTSGVDLSSLAPGRKVSLGQTTVVEITGECEPCSRMDEIRPGLQATLNGQRGMLARVLDGGTVTVGDAVRVS